MPRNFSFVIDDVLAGMERPGTFAALREDLAFLRNQGIGAVVSLTVRPLEEGQVEATGFRYLHLPVVDFTPPTLEQVARFMAFWQEAESASVPVVVHCGAGKGRTGTMLACALVWRGMRAQGAMTRVRELRPHSIETRAQEELVRTYERVVRQEMNGAQGT